jgi:hypothetical protein
VKQIVTNLFVAAKIERMQSNKASKKTRKDVSEPVPANTAEVSSITEKTAKSRASKSSLSKSETGETASAKTHRKAATVNAPEAALPEPVSAPKAMAAAAGSSATASIVVDGAGLDSAPVAKSTPEISQARVQELAYQFWVADGKPHGHHFEHWLRAERELGVRE